MKRGYGSDKAPSQSGDKNCNYKDEAYYEINPVFRAHFKRTCSRLGLNFKDFEETLCSSDGWYHYKRNGRDVNLKRYTYKRIVSKEMI